MGGQTTNASGITIKLPVAQLSGIQAAGRLAPAQKGTAARPWKTCAAMLVRVQSAANSAEVISWMQAPLANSSGKLVWQRAANSSGSAHV